MRRSKWLRQVNSRPPKVGPIDQVVDVHRLGEELGGSQGSRLDRRVPAPYLTSLLINASVKYAMTPDPLTTTFSALADPTRRAILGRLAAGEASVTEVAEPFAMSLPAVSRHLKVLQRAGLIARGRNAQWRPCRLAPEPLKEASEWLDAYRQFWEESLDNLAEYLKGLQPNEPAP